MAAPKRFSLKSRVSNPNLVNGNGKNSVFTISSKQNSKRSSKSPRGPQSKSVSHVYASSKHEPKNKKAEHKSVAYAKPVTVSELHKQAQEFEKQHKKDTTSLATLNAAQLYLEKYWAFYLGHGRNATAMNEKIMAFFEQNAYSETFLMYQLAINAREVLITNKINLPFGANGDEPKENELRECMPMNKPKVVAAVQTPPNLKSGNSQILALFASLQNENNV